MGLRVDYSTLLLPKNLKWGGWQILGCIYQSLKNIEAESFKGAPNGSYPTHLKEISNYMSVSLWCAWFQ